MDALRIRGEREALAAAQAAGQNIPHKHATFCSKLGISHYRVELQNMWTRHIGTPAGAAVAPGMVSFAAIIHPVRNGYYYEIDWAYTYHSWQYWFTASLINTLYLTQIVIGATATTLGSVGMASKATQRRTTVITILTAVATVIAGILAFFKSRGQPNRVRQLRNDLRKVCDHIRFMELEFRDPACSESVEAAIQEVKRMYDLARANAETNYPDTWSTSATPRPK